MNTIPTPMADAEIIAVRKAQVGRYGTVDPTKPYADSIAFARAILAARDAQQPQAEAVPSDVQRFAIIVEKELCQALGIAWAPSGMSIVSLIERLKVQQPQAEAVPFNHATQLQIAYVKGLGDGAMQGQAVPVEVVRDAVVAEREACAVLAQQFASQVGDLAWGVAAAIRARREATPQQAVPKFVWGYAVRNPKEPGVPHKLAYYKTQADAQACQFYCAEIIPLVAAAPQQAEAVPPTPITSGAMANQRDADRYRWLRRITVIHQQMGEQTRLGRLSTLDAAIDAALAAQGAKT